MAQTKTEGYTWLKCSCCGNDDPSKFNHVEKIHKYRRIAPGDDGILYAKDNGDWEDANDDESWLECAATKADNVHDICGSKIPLPKGHPFWDVMEWA